MQFGNQPECEVGIRCNVQLCIQVRYEIQFRQRATRGNCLCEGSACPVRDDGCMETQGSIPIPIAMLVLTFYLQGHTIFLAVELPDLCFLTNLDGTHVRCNDLHPRSWENAWLLHPTGCLCLLQRGWRHCPTTRFR